jgi:hypothetical protein
VDLTIAETVRAYAFASVWCFYAAIMSAIIDWQFRHANIDIATPNGSSRPSGRTSCHARIRIRIIAYVRPVWPADRIGGNEGAAR